MFAIFLGLNVLVINDDLWEAKVVFMLGLLTVTSSNGNIFRVTGPVWGEFTGHRLIPHTKASDVELWCFPWSGPE